MNNLSVKIVESIAEIPAEQWNLMVTDNHPFTQHAFLHALEKHDCVGKKFGWLPKHLAVYQNQQLIAAMPCYEKHNNYGEFVFDQAWEQAWNQIGLPYYPKLVSAIPYTPVMGQRILTKQDLSITEKEYLLELIYQTLTDACDHQQMSGAHVLFANYEQQKWLNHQQDQHLYKRLGYQFHWRNQNFTSFEDFLSTLKSKKRNNIIRERKSFTESNIHFRTLNGHQATEQDWANFDYFYQKTFLEKWSTPTLNRAFFEEIGKTMPENIVLVLADIDDECIAGALMFKSDTHLYGRHWGTIKEVSNLHFETCFYQGIEYAIENGLQVFEPGAGGEHKIARGFTPIEIESFHWLPLNPFGENLDKFIDQEALAVRDYLKQCESMSPYKQPI